MARSMTYWSGVVNALADKPLDRFDDFVEAQKKAEEVMMRYDDQARRCNRIRGAYVRFQVADGYALYEVCAVDKHSAYLLHVRLWDGYRCATMEEMAEPVMLKVGSRSTCKAFKVRREAAENNVRARWALEEMFGG